VIDRVSHEPVTIALRETFRTAIRETDTVEAIRIEIGAGSLQGVGYATATPAITGDTPESIQAHVEGPGADLLLGAPISTIDQVISALSNLHGLVGRSPSGTAGLDLAMHDLLFRQRSFAPEMTEVLRSSAQGSVRTSVTISAGSLTEMVATARSRVAAGFTVVKAKLGLDPSGDLARLIAIAQALDAASSAAGSNVELWIDANQGWSVEQAIATVDRALGMGITIARLEQPTKRADIAGLATVRHRLRQMGIHVPVVADEAAATMSDIAEIAERGAADIVNVKLMKFGGLTGGRLAIAEIRRHGMGVLIGSMMEHPYSVAAAVDLAAEQIETVHDLDAGWWATDQTPLIYENGTVKVVRL
jgi:L-Ala-D/L-Glu epimerase